MKYQALFPSVAYLNDGYEALHQFITELLSLID